MSRRVLLNRRSRKRSYGHNDEEVDVCECRYCRPWPCADDSTGDKRGGAVVRAEAFASLTFTVRSHLVHRN